MTFIDDLFDKADEALDGMEKMSRSGRDSDPPVDGIVLAAYGDGHRVIFDSMGETSEDSEEPEWVKLRFLDAEGNSRVRNYKRDRFRDD